MAEEGKLVERLLAIDSSHIGDGRYCNWPRNPDGPEAAARIADLERRLQVAESALKAVEQGDIPRAVDRPWRGDGKPCKHDLCEHGMHHWQDCFACTSNFVSAKLTEIGASHE